MKQDTGLESVGMCVAVGGAARWVSIALVVVVLIAVSVARRVEAADQWISIGPAGQSTVERVNAFAVDPLTPTTLYAGTSSGLYKSTNSGGSWTVTSLTNTEVTALVFDPSTRTTLYAGTRGSIAGGTGGGYSRVPTVGGVGPLSTPA